MNAFKRKRIYAAIMLGLSVASFSQVSQAEDVDVRIGYIDGNTFSNKEVTYEVKDNLAIFEGDIILGTVDEMNARASGISTNSVVVAGEEYRWPDNTVPYEFAADFPVNYLEYFQAEFAKSVQHYHDNTNITLIERTAENAHLYPDYVSIEGGSGCRSTVGRRGGRQHIVVTVGCSSGPIIHELGHTLGLWHEQGREDRDAFVDIIWDNIEEGKEHNFSQHITDGDDIGAYDYASIMHYPRVGFSKNGEPTIVPLDASAEIGQTDGLSDGDLAALASLYPPQGVCAGLAAPDAINISNVTQGGFTATWSAVADADTYLIKTLADGEFKDYLASSATTHDFTGFMGDTLVGVRVQSQKSDCGVSDAITINVIDTLPCNGTPGVTDNAVFSDVAETSLSVSWDAVEGADYYSVETVSEGVFTTYENVTATSMAFSDFEPGVYVGILIKAHSKACGSSEEEFGSLVKLVEGGSYQVEGISSGWFGWNRYTVEVPEGMGTLTVNLAGGSGNASLYLSQGEEPSTSSYDCRSKNSGNDESCVITNPAAGTWHIGVYSGWSSVSDANLNAQWRP